MKPKADSLRTWGGGKIKRQKLPISVMKEIMSLEILWVLKE